jgi:3-deoxy-7-phosphoheptulonate synthase
MKDWTPVSWQRMSAAQQPHYEDPGALNVALERLAAFPPLVTSWEVERLKKQLGEAAAGQRFLLQGGACAESFRQCRSEVITNKLKILLQMSLVLTFGIKRQIIRVGRFAGQYAKPRSSDSECRGDVTLPTYRGDLVNAPEFSLEARRPDPERLISGYQHSALTLNFIRALVDGGFADLHHPEYWDLDFVVHSSRAREYQSMVETISDSLRFMETLAGIQAGQISRVDFFTSHEGLHLGYEQAQTRKVPHKAGWFNLSTHFPWLGVRTSDPGGAHVEYFRGIVNPIGIKIGPEMTSQWLGDLLRILDPEKEPGRVTLIHRLGHRRVAKILPGLVECVRSLDHPVVWCCDPMHGNTETTGEGIKTRHFDNILSELEQSFDIHRDCGSYLGGVHFELSGENVTECIGGARGLSEEDLRRSYRSLVDPRLNYEQSLEMALRVARKMAAVNGFTEK